MTDANQKTPMQPVVFDPHGVVRFKANPLVKALLEAASEGRHLTMNDLACMGFSKEDRAQFAQLIGYSVAGYGDLSYASPESVQQADAAAEALLKERGERLVKEGFPR